MDSSELDMVSTSEETSRNVFPENPTKADEGVRGAREGEGEGEGEREREGEEEEEEKVAYGEEKEEKELEEGGEAKLENEDFFEGEAIEFPSTRTALTNASISLFCL